MILENYPLTYPVKVDESPDSYLQKELYLLKCPTKRLLFSFYYILELGEIIREGFGNATRSVYDNF